jgi:MFS family permease
VKFRAAGATQHGFRREFQLLWAATGLSNLGDGLRIVALPLLATSVTTDPRLIAGVTIAERLPWLIFILPGGAWADRVDRRVLRMRLDFARAVVMAGLVVVILADRASIGVIYLVAALLSSGEAIVDSSSMALVPATVDDNDLERAGGRLTSTELVTNDLIGPPLGGLLFGLAVAVPFGLDAVSFAAAALMISMMSGSYATNSAVSASATTQRTAIRGDIAAGFRWLWHDRLLRRLAIISTALGTASFIGNAVFVLFARETLGLSAFGYGLLLVPGAFGGIAGSMLAPRMRRFPLGVALAGAVLMSGVATWVMSLVSSPILAALLAAVSLGSVMVWNVLTVALRQRVIPDEWLGRVGASYRFLVFLGMPFGALIGGLLANALSIRSAIFVSGSLLFFLGATVPVLLRGATKQTLEMHGARAIESLPDDSGPPER